MIRSPEAPGQPHCRGERPRMCNSQRIIHETGRMTDCSIAYAILV